ncbi:MAG: type II secretion system ATPase GspE [Simkaniaceae bacterium]
MTLSAILTEDQLKKLSIDRVESLISTRFVKEKKKLLSYSFVKEHKLLPFDEKNERVQVAFSDPFDLDTIEELRLILKRPISVFFADPIILESAIELCYHQEEGETGAFLKNLNQSQTLSEEKEASDGYDLLDSNSSSSVIQMLNMILQEAVQQEVSDIHFEPLERGVIVRYRIDGVLQKRHAPPRDLQDQLITRIKVMAQLDIAEHRLPQDGRIKLKMAGREIDFRVSTVPVVFGERVVLRILDKGHMALGLKHLHMPKLLLSRFEKFMRQNQGIILVTGPTGSGKTTTLYSAISDINSPDVNIMTVEDPVEYKLPGMAQIGVNPKIKLTFSTGLRHILRQDPDIIMIGEIRDRETAEIAIQSSLTGHLVLSTLHTNDAPSAITRLIDMGIEPYLISSSVLAVLAQRLVRTLCPHCPVPYEPLAEECIDLGLKPLKTLFYRKTGCDKCYGSGYKGRQGIYELMGLNAELKREMLKNPDSSHLREIAKRTKMTSLRDAGAQLVIDGITTSEEVLRVTRAEDL